MNKLEKVVGIVLEEIKPKHSEKTYMRRKSSLNRLLRFAQANGFDEPCQKLYDAFTEEYKSSKNKKFTLFHTVRLVDRVANTRGKDKSGKFLNEPPLPEESDVFHFFAKCSFPIDTQVDISYLIVFSEHLIRQYDLSNSTIGQYRHSWIDIRRYCFDSGTSLYQKDTIKDYIRETTELYKSGQIKLWKWKISRKAAFVLIEVAETGTFRWERRSQYELSCGNSELDAVRDKYIQFLREKNIEPATISLHDYVFRFGLKHAEITQLTELRNLNEDTVNKIIHGFSDACNDRSVSTIITILKKILQFYFNEGLCLNV